VSDPKKESPEEGPPNEFQLAEPYQPPRGGASPQARDEPALGERLGQETGYRPDGVRKAQPQDLSQRSIGVFAIKPEAPKKSIVGRLIILALACAAAFGGYYGFCRYKVGDKIWEFDLQVRDNFQNELNKLQKNIDPPDITSVVLKLAKLADVETTPEDIVSTILPFNSTTENKLPVVQVRGVQIAKSLVPTSGDVWVVGYSGRFRARHGIVKQWFVHQRYTWFQWVDKTKYPLE